MITKQKDNSARGMTGKERQKTTKGAVMYMTYYFDELELLKDYSVLAAGEADIEYRMASAEPDVGIFEPWASDIDITSISIYSTKKDAPPLNLSQDHWLYKLIYDALMDDSDYIQQRCEWDAAANCGGDYE